MRPSARFNPAIIRESTPKRIVTTGLYSHMRNPLYSGVILLAIGWSLVQQAVYSLFLFPLILFVVLYYVIVKGFEEPRLLQLFGKEFEEYKKRAPAFFPLYLKIPLIILIVVVITFTIMGWIPIS